MEGQEERESATSPPDGSGRNARGRLLAAYVTIAVLVLIVLAAILVLSSGSNPTAPGNPHINLDSGITNGIAPDNRAGIAPPDLEELGLEEAARAAGCELRLRLPDEGHEHIPAGAPEPPYRTKPPTSGDHVDEQQADGAYRETPSPVNVVHSLEHARLAIQYQPSLPRHAQLELIGLFHAMYGGTLLFPNSEMPYRVGATTWTNLMGCRSHHGAKTLAAIEAFGRATWGKFGGEPVIGLQPTAPTPNPSLSQP